MEAKRRINWVKILIVAVPVWLLVSGGIGLWAHFHYEEKERQEQRHAFRKDINALSLVDDFNKITQQIGPRYHASEEGRNGLQRMASMIEGSLGISNIGYEVKKVASLQDAESVAPLLLADVMRRETKEEIWLIVPYDSPASLPRGAASASAVSVSFAVAQSLVGQPLQRNVRFLYVPMAYAEEQRLDMAAQVRRLIGSTRVAVQVLVLGSMLHEGKMLALARDTELPLLRDAGDLIVISEGTEICFQDDGEISSLLHEMNVPAALLFKKPDSEMSALLEDGIQAPAKVLAQSAEQVVAVLLRLSNPTQKK